MSFALTGNQQKSVADASGRRHLLPDGSPSAAFVSGDIGGICYQMAHLPRRMLAEVSTVGPPPTTKTTRDTDDSDEDEGIRGRRSRRREQH